MKWCQWKSTSENSLLHQVKRKLTKILRSNFFKTQSFPRKHHTQGSPGQDSALSWTKKPFPGGVCWDNYKQLYNSVAAWDDGQLLGLIQKLKGKWDAQRGSESCHIPGRQPHMSQGWTHPHGKPGHLPMAEPEALCGRKFFRKWKTRCTTPSLISSQPAARPWGATPPERLNFLTGLKLCMWAPICLGQSMCVWENTNVAVHGWTWDEQRRLRNYKCLHAYLHFFIWFHQIQESITQK